MDGMEKTNALCKDASTDVHVRSLPLYFVESAEAGQKDRLGHRHPRGLMLPLFVRAA